MFITLLVVTFFISLAVSALVVYFFRTPIDGILNRILQDEISKAWARYLYFAIFVVGISSGVRVWELEKYVTQRMPGDIPVPDLNRDRWVLEVYRTVIESLQGLAWVLLVFFIIALVAFIIVRISEMVGRSSKGQTGVAVEDGPSAGVGN
jgi:ABC-type multidrug transport system fused ATPase/permease subunit